MFDREREFIAALLEPQEDHRLMRAAWRLEVDSFASRYVMIPLTAAALCACAAMFAPGASLLARLELTGMAFVLVPIWIAVDRTFDEILGAVLPPLK